MLGIDVRVAVTHLDHMSSRERRRQTQHLLHTLNGRGDGGAALVIGDLNALRRTDYTDDEWAWHHRYNDEKQWGAPVDEASEGGAHGFMGGGLAEGVAHGGDEAHQGIGRVHVWRVWRRAGPASKTGFLVMR
jgi:hypothetical protein